MIKYVLIIITYFTYLTTHIINLIYHIKFYYNNIIIILIELLLL